MHPSLVCLATPGYSTVVQVVSFFMLSRKYLTNCLLTVWHGAYIYPVNIFSRVERTNICNNSSGSGVFLGEAMCTRTK